MFKWIIFAIVIILLLVFLGPLIFPAMGIVFLFLLISGMFDNKKKNV